MLPPAAYQHTRHSEVGTGTSLSGLSAFLIEIISGIKFCEEDQGDLNLCPPSAFEGSIMSNHVTLPRTRDDVRERKIAHRTCRCASSACASVANRWRTPPAWSAQAGSAVIVSFQGQHEMAPALRQVQVVPGLDEKSRPSALIGHFEQDQTYSSSTN